MNILSDLLAFARAHETTIIGFIVGVVVLVAGKAGMVLSDPSVAAVVGPIVAGILADIRLSYKRNNPTPVAPPGPKPGV